MPVSINNTTLTFNDGTTQTTAATGTVSSVATGNGLQGGTITTSGTLSVAAPGFNTVGSYCYVNRNNGGGATNSGSNYAAGGGSGQIRSGAYNSSLGSFTASANLSGTWRWMAAPNGSADELYGVGCRVS